MSLSDTQCLACFNVPMIVHIPAQSLYPPCVCVCRSEIISVSTVFCLWQRSYWLCHSALVAVCTAYCAVQIVTTVHYITWLFCMWMVQLHGPHHAGCRSNATSNEFFWQFLIDTLSERWHFLKFPLYGTVSLALLLRSICRLFWPHQVQLNASPHSNYWGSTLTQTSPGLHTLIVSPQKLANGSISWSSLREREFHINSFSISTLQWSAQFLNTLRRPGITSLTAHRLSTCNQSKNGLSI